ncbi:MAG: hypothetical protein AVDCRST_MAG91-162 [uncultured Sphingomonadaceae bacterium]|uniref:Inositolphosphotransferase Aur1/Ipt1 domain-containing protein n=1 Tax=uncultured Sphingomonadaceae bacterium TaxID=169976 RepID=A0A6J4S686_9SPHN|nr:MAG: hypothetical protein AVDCRST_MAG91-162 [uncultured Sphingomonadaceae bacterium]
MDKASQVADRDWLAPSIVLTLMSGAVGILLIPDHSGVVPALAVLPLWMIGAAILGSIYALFAMMSARVESPLACIGAFFVQERRTAAFLTFCVFLAGVNMTTFMWIKPLLNHLIPFWADPLLADIDKAIFFGRDPWTLLTWSNTTAAAIFYHRGWFILMILTLLAVLSAPPSPKKSALMLTYFMLWSVVGPVIHALIPAAGPVFFAQLGYGDRFSELGDVTETREAAAYLWAIYSGGGFGPGSGISAMPSLHVATTAWMITAVHVYSRLWMWPMAIAALATILLSVSLGWHYAVDGVVGAAAALLCYKALHIFYGSRSKPAPRSMMPA